MRTYQQSFGSLVLLHCVIHVCRSNESRFHNAVQLFVFPPLFPCDMSGQGGPFLQRELFKEYNSGIHQWFHAAASLQTPYGRGRKIEGRCVTHHVTLRQPFPSVPRFISERRHTHILNQSSPKLSRKGPELSATNKYLKGFCVPATRSCTGRDFVPPHCILPRHCIGSTADDSRDQGCGRASRTSFDAQKQDLGLRMVRKLCPS